MTAYKMVALFEEEAVKSYTEYLFVSRNGEGERPATQSIIAHNMDGDARLSIL